MLKLRIGIWIHECWLKPVNFNLFVYFYFSLSPQLRTCSWPLYILLQTNMTPQACGRKISQDITSEHVFASWKTLMVLTNPCLSWVVNWGFHTQICKHLVEEIAALENSFLKKKDWKWLTSWKMNHEEMNERSVFITNKKFMVMLSIVVNAFSYT